jgi:chemotaxis protein MotB
MANMAFLKKGKGGGGEINAAWLLTYGDLVTLLFAFFLIIAAMSKPDEAKYEELREGMVKSVSKHTEVKKPLHHLFEELQKVIKNEKMEKLISAEMNQYGIKLEFSSGLLFKSGDAELMPDALPIMEKVVGVLQKVSEKDYKLSIEGHTDNVPIKTAKYPSNWELSTARATNVLRVMLAKGMEPERLKASGLADMSPKAPNMDQAGKPLAENQMKNRRVVINVYR